MPVPKARGRPFDRDLSQAHKSEGGGKALNSPSLGFCVLVFRTFSHYLYPDANGESHPLGLAAFYGHPLEMGIKRLWPHSWQ